jgi:hypothetical protein
MTGVLCGSFNPGIQGQYSTPNSWDSQRSKYPLGLPDASPSVRIADFAE